MSTIVTIRRSSARASGSALEQVGCFTQTVLAGIEAAISWFGEKLEQRRSRRALEEMSDSQLKDIGISRADAFREARRPFWD